MFTWIANICRYFIFFLPVAAFGAVKGWVGRWWDSRYK
jgi:hypothetical protein